MILLMYELGNLLFLSAWSQWPLWWRQPTHQRSWLFPSSLALIWVRATSLPIECRIQASHLRRNTVCAVAVSLRENFCTRDDFGDLWLCHCVKISAHETILTGGSENMSPVHSDWDPKIARNKTPHPLAPTRTHSHTLAATRICLSSWGSPREKSNSFLKSTDKFPHQISSGS